MNVLTVSIKGEAKDAHGITGLPGIYVLGPNSINGKSHWLQESGSYAIWYSKGIGWGIGSQDELANGYVPSLLSFDDVTSPHEASTWKHYNGKLFIPFDDILVESGTVVYQKPKLLAETESFQLSAFGFGRRK